MARIYGGSLGFDLLRAILNPPPMRTVLILILSENRYQELLRAILRSGDR